MKRKTIFGQPALHLFTLLVILSLLAGCNLPASAGGVSVWIDVPLDGLAFPSVQGIKISGHAASPGGVSRVEIWINSALLTTINDPITEGELARFYTEWTPTAPGEYVIQALAFGADGTASQPDSARVTFGDVAAPVISVTPVVTDTPTPVISVTPVVTDTPTATSTPPPDAVVQFWAEPAEIRAGACTTIRWHAENVQRVIFGGIDQSLDGSYRECLCSNQRYTLTIIHLDGTEERRPVDVAVSGVCVTPTPPDTTPPPAPTPAVPANGLTLSCRASQNLVWLPVSDPSGISGYYVKLEMEVTPGNWRSAGGYGPVTDKQVNVTVQCGGIYRWMVRAQDGAGNVGPWSGWWQFAITLS
ncbi:MAG: hypothetical protein KJ606_01270 [Chloroflexi bacterium]|nr:hypothetical protein [Chloroflexota bacterium]